MDQISKNRCLLPLKEFYRVKRQFSSSPPYYRFYNSMLIHKGLRLYLGGLTPLVQQELHRKLYPFKHLGVELNAECLDELQAGPPGKYAKLFLEELQNIEKWKLQSLERHWSLLNQDAENLYQIAWPLVHVDASLYGLSPNKVKWKALSALKIPIAMNTFMHDLLETFGPCQYNFLSEDIQEAQILIIDSLNQAHYYDFNIDEPIKYPKQDFLRSIEGLQVNLERLDCTFSFKDKLTTNIDYQKLSYVHL